MEDVFTFAEVAAAARIPVQAVEQLVAEGELVYVAPGFVAGAEAMRRGGRLKTRAAELATGRADTLFAPARAEARNPALPAAVSGMAHAGVFVAALALAAFGDGATAAARFDAADAAQARLVFLAIPGPGGGGGGGGLRQPAPAPRVKQRGEYALSSPVPPPAPKPIARPAPEPPPAPEPAVVAPVASRPSDERDQAGVVERAPAESESHGPGIGGGAGTGTGSGAGEGTGPGIGPGDGGGMGGGPYRPGSGVEPPRLLREVRADYTEEARRLGLVGDVLLEIVVRRDGSVGDIRVLQGLGHGLDRQAVDAVRAWRFAPARRLGTPVDVLVEVAVEFRLR